MLVCPKHKHFIDGDVIDWDTETTGVNAWGGDKPFAFSFANEGGETKCFTFDVDPMTREPIVRPKILEMIQRLLEDIAIRKSGFNVKFDVRMMHRAYAIRTLGRVDDVMWMAHVCNSSEMKHALKPLSDKYAGVDNSDEEELGAAVKSCRLKVKKLGWKIAKGDTKGEDASAYKADYWLPAAIVRLAPPEIKNPLLARWPNLAALNDIYATKDAVRTCLLRMMYSNVMDEEGLWDVYERELRMFPVTYRTEQIGVRIFPERCAEVSKECDTNLVRLRNSLSKIFGTFEVEVSDAKVRHHLFAAKKDGGLELPVIKRTSGGKSGIKTPSVDKDVKDYYKHIPVVRDLQDFDKYHKAKSHYIQKYLRHGVPDADGQLIVHADFKQLQATTGRMACASPPLQQTPKRAKKGEIMKRVRYPFGPRKRNVWVHYDYKSIEPRILAEEAQEEDIIRIFNAGGDPYLVLVDRVADATKWSVEELESMFEGRGGARQVCKNNFLGWTYGEGVKKLAAQMGCTLEVAFQIIAALQSAFGGVGPFMKYMQQTAKRDGCIRNRYGRKAVIPPPARVLDEDGHWVWVEFWYKATNYLIQGTAADMLKAAAIRLGGLDTVYDRQCLPQKVKPGYLTGTGAEIVLFIHDEIVVEMPLRKALNEKFVRGIGDVMADNEGMFKRVATPTDINVTYHAWSDPEKVETLWS